LLAYRYQFSVQLAYPRACERIRLSDKEVLARRAQMYQWIYHKQMATFSQATAAESMTEINSELCIIA